MHFAFLTRVITALALLSHACLVAASPTTDLAPAVRAPSTTCFHWAGPATTFVYDNSGKQIAAIRPGDNVTSSNVTSLDLAPATDPGLLTTAFDTAVKITEVVCKATGPIACVATGIISLFGVFFSAYLLNGCDLVHAHMLVTDFPPIRGCGTICRLRNKAPEGDWRLIGNATTNGVFHAVHYSRIGSISGLRAVQYPGGAKGLRR
ncbi:hypothetical protein B0H16DRAFT_1824344 [Mycena metata]|uniref:Uncharacterized protein n=1 Tax=Mycena metata TaxID=1033252 RepID=A0AAD7GX24_9AGAR|nr:hypothetical protein B0H16DRAFT_1824344 [Mycena metata]